MRAGDTIQLDGPRGPVPLRVVGTVVDYSWNRGSLFVDRGYYRKQFDDDLVDVFDVYFPPTASDQEKDGLRQAVHDWGAKQAMFVLNKEQLIEKIAGVVNRLYGIAYVQQIVVGVVAALGVILALLISVLQRRREMGLLRAVGATQRQVLGSVVAEATLMGILGTVIGVVAGFPLECYIVKTVIFHESGFAFPILVPWTEAVWIIGTSVFIATLAGLGPALRAVRMRIADAIAYE